MSGHYRTSKPTVHKKETKFNFAWRSVSSDEATSRVKSHVSTDSEGLCDFDKVSEDWRILLDDSDDSTLGWGQNSSSSSASWSDDLESEATAQLQNQLNVLDKVIFGEDLTLEEKAVHIPNDLLEEATLWRTSYPHLRIRGVSLPVPPLQGDFENTEEVLASHWITEDVDQEGDEPVKVVSGRISPKINSLPSSVSANLKADVMKRLFDHLWPDVLETVKSKILSCPKESLGSLKDTEPLPFLPRHQPMTSAKGYYHHTVGHEPKLSSNSLEIPDKFVHRSTQQSSKGNVALDSILKVSPLPLKRSAASNGPSHVVQRSYHVLSSRGQTHLISNRNHVTLPPIEVPSEPARINSFEGSLTHLRTTSALSRENHKMTGSRPNTSNLISAEESVSKSSFISVSPSNLTKNLSFNVLGKHLPANSNSTWYKSNQRKTNIHR